MTPVFCCGMECGVSTAHMTTVANSSFTTSSPLTGLRSGRVNPTSATAEFNTAKTFGAGLLVIRANLKFTTLPSADTMIIENTVANTAGALFQASDSKIYAKSDTTVGTNGVSVTTGVLYTIDLRINTTANPWLVDVQVNGVACTQASGARTASTLAAGVSIRCNPAATADFLVDDLIISATSGDYPIGAGKVLSFVPNADGTHTSTSTNIVKGTTGTPVGAAITSSTTDAFNWVNGRPILGGASDSTRLINQQTVASTEYVEVAFEDTTEVNPPRAVEVLTADREASTATGNFQTKLNDNGTEDAIANRGTVAGSTSDRYITKQYAAMVGGGAWTLTRFNGLKARFGYSSDATPDQYWRGIMIEAEFPTITFSDYELLGRPYGALGAGQMQQLLAT